MSPSGRPALMGRLRRSAAPTAKRWLFGVGAYHAVRTLRPSRRLAILRYHAVCGPEGYAYADPTICVTPQAFERHVAYLAARYRVLSLPDAVRCLNAGNTLPANTVCITFDDGYADNLEAARVLHRHGVSGTFYITAACLAGEQPFWPAEIRELVARVPAPEIRLTSSGKDVVIPCASESQRQVAIRTLAKLLKGHPIPVRERLRDELRRAADCRTASSPMLTWDQLREMHRLGMTIGAHTLTHANLPNAGLADAWQEISGSKSRLEKEIDAQVTMFSYPNGGAERYITAEIAGLVRKAGYEAATTSWNGFAGPASDLFALERVQVVEELEALVFALEIERFAFTPQPRS